jgi:hypothetical protein
MNIIHSEPGILFGFTIKYLYIRIFLKKIRRIKIPLWVMGYNRKEAKYVQDLTKYFSGK